MLMMSDTMQCVNSVTNIIIHSVLQWMAYNLFFPIEVEYNDTNTGLFVLAFLYLWVAIIEFSRVKAEDIPLPVA